MVFLRTTFKSRRYSLSNWFGAIVSMSLILQDYRVASMILTFLVSGVWSAFVDAMPSAMRRKFGILGSSAAIFGMIFIQLGLFMKWILITEVTYTIGNVTFTCSNITTSCLTNIIVFLCRNVLAAILKPKSMTVINSEVQSLKISKIEARVLYAAFHVNEVARYLEEKEEITEEGR